MKNFILGIIIIIAIAAGVYYAWGREDDTELDNNIPNVTDDSALEDDQNISDDSMMDDDAMMEEDDTATPPATGGNNPDNSTPPAPTPQSEVKTFTITGAPFEFSVKEIRVKQGDTVVINFSSTTGFHDWVVDAFNSRTAQVNPGTPTSVTFVASEIGSFEYYCSVGNHRAMGMVGSLIVE